MNIITTLRHLDAPPSEETIARLTEFLDRDAVELAATYPGLNAIAFMLAADGSHLLSFTMWPDDTVMRSAEVSYQHLRNSELIEEMLGVTRPREQGHYRLLVSRNLGGSVIEPTAPAEPGSTP
jgi:hypothetical protein